MSPRLRTSSAASPGTSGPAAALRILIADDSRDYAESLAILLRLEGHDVRTAYDGVEALLAAEEYRPHVVVLDLSMPELDGDQVAERLRAEEWGRDAFLIAVTGLRRKGDQFRARAAGIDAYFVKPVDPHELIRLLREIS